MMQTGTKSVSQPVKLFDHGVDTLFLNVCNANKQEQPARQELDEQMAAILDYLQGEARSAETAVALNDPSWAYRYWLTHMAQVRNDGGYAPGRYSRSLSRGVTSMI